MGVLVMAVTSLCLCKSRAEVFGAGPAPNGGSGMGGQSPEP